MLSDSGVHMSGLVTVVTTNYNGRHLKETIRSVLRQTYPQIEYIIIDDGSKHFPAEKIERFILANKKRSLQYKILINPENKGTVRTLNEAYRAANGKIVFHLACDDLFEDERVIEDWVRFFERHEADVVTAYRDIYDSQMRHKLKSMPRSFEVRRIKNSSSRRLFECMESRNYIYGCCTARTKKSIETYGYLDESYRLLEDWPAYLRLLRNGCRIAFYDRTVIRYRSGGVSAPGNLSRRVMEDNDRAFRQEVLPYTRCRPKAVCSYAFWKMRQRVKGLLR